MKKILLIIVLLMLNIPCLAHDLILDNVKTQVYFSPNGGCQQAIINEIDKATSSVYVQAYSFTSVPIAVALINAKNRGAKVAVILDKNQTKEKYSVVPWLEQGHVPIYKDSGHTIAHNKVIILDGKTVITGSFNFSKAAEEKNSENVIIISSKELATIYNNNFAGHLSHSTIFR